MRVTWLPESSTEGILFLAEPLFTSGHVVTALCITSNLTLAQTFWLVIDSNISAILFWVFLSNQSGPLTMSPPDWCNILRSFYFLAHEAQYLYSWLAWQSLPAPAAWVHCYLIIMADRDVFYVACVLAIVAGHIWLECPICTMSQLVLSSAYQHNWKHLYIECHEMFWALFHRHIADCFCHGLH